MIDWNNPWEVFGFIVSSVGGIGVIVTGLASLIANVIVKNITTKFETKIKTQFDLLSKTINRYNEEQFKIYNDIWKALYALKLSADLLWVSAQDENLRVYIKDLKKASDTIGFNCLFIEEPHYDQLMHLLQLFGDYSNGKGNLIKERTTGHVVRGDLYWINNNEQILTQYKTLIEEIRRKFREQLHFQENPQNL